MSTVRDVITNALYELQALAPGEPLTAEDASFGLSKLNRMLDQWNAQRRFAYNVNFYRFTLQAGHQPHTIGPTGDFITTPGRPVRIENAALVIPGEVDLPINTSRDDDWWANKRVKTLQSSVPTDLYYSPDVPNGNLYFWPIPAASYDVRLELWIQLANVTLDTELTLPFGYEEALTMSLAEGLAGPYQSKVDVSEKARKARAVITANNSKSPRIATDGVSGSGQHSTFNWMSGQ